jgi:Cu-Zn family superoxide dismutase
MSGARIVLAAACMLSAPMLAQAQEAARATFVNIDGREIGWAELTNTPHGVLIAARVTDLPSGGHGFHIHETGQCNVSDGFESAGGHFAPAGKSHGFSAPAGPHAGDMANQFVQSDGTLRVEVFNPAVTLGSGQNGLLDGDGSAIVIHANPDDYKSQPSGKAGARIACAVIGKP